MHLAFYSDVNDFGGHEVMTVHAVRYLSKNTDWHISFIVYEGNQRLIDSLSEMGVEIVLTSHCSRSLQGLRSWSQVRDVEKTMRLIATLSPDAIIVSHGGIEQCTVGLIAARKAKILSISYIPYAHKYKKMGSALGFVRDIVSPTYYRLPDFYITIGESMTRQLRSQGVTQPIFVVPNGIHPPNYSAEERETLRAEFKITDTNFVVGIIGRVATGQKGHDILIHAISKARLTDQNIRLLIMGDGPDMAKVVDLCKSQGIFDSTLFVPWRKSVGDIYAVIDLLAIASRFEGMPLVMLEAMACEKPIVAANVDGMLDTLPEEWLFDVGDSRSLTERIAEMRIADLSDQIRSNKVRALDEFSLENFGKEFKNAIETIARSHAG